ncbi:SEL1-like repeat protein [Variovorax paradoxus]|uniref:hypothetical protein n=1 Tax=Variovorax paradoxus TaxID=34073 RepID=UPI0029C8A1FB|nr:hypothetical protein RZE77_24330 [Variovorax paradoxus]
MAMRERRSPAWPALLAGVLFFAACAMLVYESTREYFPRGDLRAFDTRRAELLSAERRAEYERELFSELSQWNRLSRTYPTEADIGQRERRWRQLADEGLELAHIALQVLQPDGRFVYPLEKPMNRLLALAERGDTGAMCLMTVLVSQVKNSRWSAQHSEVARKWLLRGAERGHPECQLQLGRRLILGIDGATKDAKRGLALELTARRSGYAHDVDGLVSHFQQRWSTDPADLTRLYCWLSIDAQSRLTDGPQNMLRLLRVEAQRNDSEELMHLANQLENSRFSLQACVDLSRG